MSEVVIEAGPNRVCGPKRACPAAVSTALDCIDDDLALLDEHPVSVSALWAGILREAAGVDADAVVLVCPTWWPTARIDTVRTAAQDVAPSVAVLRRTPVLRVTHRTATIVEIAADLILVTHPDGHICAVAILGGLGAVAERVRAAVGQSVEALIDAPPGSDAAVCRAVADVLRASRIAVTFAAEDVMRRVAVSAPEAEQSPPADPPAWRRRRDTAVLAGLVATAVMCAAFGLHGGEPEGETTWLTEGRIAVMVPAGWPVQRVTSGPGSARLQIVSPRDSQVGLHLTQSVGAPEADLAQTAASLSAALSDEPGGVFVDFNPADRRAGRTAVTYREIRGDRHVAWAVLVDGDMRIAIGCQAAPGRDDRIRQVCDQAIGSAHAVP